MVLKASKKFYSTNYKENVYVLLQETRGKNETQGGMGEEGKSLIGNKAISN